MKKTKDFELKFYFFSICSSKANKKVCEIQLYIKLIHLYTSHEELDG